MDLRAAAPCESRVSVFCPETRIAVRGVYLYRIARIKGGSGPCVAGLQADIVHIEVIGRSVRAPEPQSHKVGHSPLSFWRGGNGGEATEVEVNALRLPHPRPRHRQCVYRYECPEVEGIGQQPHNEVVCHLAPTYPHRQAHRLLFAHIRQDGYLRAAPGKVQIVRIAVPHAGVIVAVGGDAQPARGQGVILARFEILAVGEAHGRRGVYLLPLIAVGFGVSGLGGGEEEVGGVGEKACEVVVVGCDMEMRGVVAIQEGVVQPVVGPLRGVHRSHHRGGLGERQVYHGHGVDVEIVYVEVVVLVGETMGADIDVATRAVVGGEVDLFLVPSVALKVGEARHSLPPLPPLSFRRGAGGEVGCAGCAGGVAYPYLQIGCTI